LSLIYAQRDPTFGVAAAPTNHLLVLLVVKFATVQPLPAKSVADSNPPAPAGSISRVCPKTFPTPKTRNAIEKTSDLNSEVEITKEGAELPL
jgi:hypothetical protein